MHPSDTNNSYQSYTILDSGEISCYKKYYLHAKFIVDDICNKRTINFDVLTFLLTFYSTLPNKDYLNPIPKDEVVQECGLRTTRRTTDIGNEYYVTTIDPIELGINMHSNTNEEILFEDDFNFNYFGSNIMA